MSGPSFVQTLEWLQPVAMRCCLASFAVMLATWFVVGCLRNHSAALRHRVLCLGLLGVVLLPALVPMSQRMSPTLRMGIRKPVTSTEPHVVDEVQDAPQHELSRLPGSYMDSYADANDALPPTVDADSESAFVLAEDIRLAQPALPVITQAETRLVALALPTIPRGSLPILAWALISVSLALRAVRDRLYLKRTLRRSIEITDQRALQMVQSIADDHGIRGAALLCSETLQVPVAIGVLRPAIVLPAGYGKWSDARLHIVLLHEMMHIGRADVLAQSTAGLACRLFWFNPLVWIAASRMRLERELASDDSVLLAGEDAVDYADHLVEIAAAIGRRFRVPAAASPMATHTNMHARVSRLMQPNIDRSQLSRRSSTTLLLLTTLVVTCLALATPTIAMTQDGAATTVATTATDAPTEATLSGDLDAGWLEKLKAMPNLERLIIRRPGTNFRAGAIAQLKSLKTLHVEDFPLGSPLADVVLKNSTQLPSLRDVTFKATGLTGGGLRTIGESSIVALALIDEEMMTDDGFEHIGEMRLLEKLYLDGTPIEAPGLEHLLNVPTLRSFTLLNDRGATKRLPVIARFPALVELELFEETFPDLVILKEARSLRRLTLRHCGAFKASESLEQLDQLDRIELDNADIRNETLDDVQRRLAISGIEVVDISRAADRPSDRTQPPNEATKLARKVHRAMDFAKNHPVFWVRWSNSSGDIAAMQEEPMRTIYKLKKALDEPSVASDKSFDSLDYVMAWSPGQFYYEGKYFKDGKVSAEYYKHGDATLAWGRERYSQGAATNYFLRNGAADFADSLFGPPPLKIALQSYWWGTGKGRWADHNIATNPYSADSVTYEELESEEFGGERCRVVQSAGRSERLWISVATGRLRGVLTYGSQGFRTPFYKQAIVTEIVGHPVASSEEYRELLSEGSSRLSKEKLEQLGIAWSEYAFEHAIPWHLHELDDYREISPATWYPFKVRSAGWHHNDKNNQYYSFYNAESVAKEVRTDLGDLRPVWQPLLPTDGEKIQDQRFPVPFEYEYRQGRTAGEIEELASAAFFDQAKSAMSWEARRSPLNGWVGNSAIELPAEGWIGERPDLQGKSYLLHFWATWCGPCKNDIPWLNEIAKNSIVIGVHPSGTSEDEIRKSMAGEKMSYPTIMSATDARNPLGYPVSMYPYCIQVDEKGNVVKHGLLHDVLGTTSPISSRKDVAANPKVSGAVKALNKEEGLFQLSLGTQHGIEPQQILDVLRDGRRVGQLRVVLAKENQSVGKADRQEEADRIIVGDTIQL